MLEPILINFEFKIVIFTFDSVKNYYTSIYYSYNIDKIDVIYNSNSYRISNLKGYNKFRGNNKIQVKLDFETIENLIDYRENKFNKLLG